MTNNKETHTIDHSGALMTVELEGVSMPADYSFECVNDYVHHPDRHYEELQWLALGMANEIEKLRKDAERYRWLRNQGFGFSCQEENRGITTCRWGEWAFNTREGFAYHADYAIDAAMQELKP